MGAEFSDLDEKLFFGLRGVELERERVATEVVQRIAKAGCSRRVDGEHVHPVGMPIGQMERLRLKLAAYVGGRDTNKNIQVKNARTDSSWGVKGEGGGGGRK